MRKRFPWFEIVLLVVYLSAQIYAASSDPYNLSNRWFIRDDAYYYFKVAQNISEGHGSTFDGIHPTNGYHPLWLLICIPIFALARYDLILPLRILLLLTSLFQVGTAILLYRILKRIISTPVAMLAAVYWTFDTQTINLLYKTGMESGVALFLIALLLYLLYVFEEKWRGEKPSLGQIAVFGVVALLVTFGRLDLIFFSLIVGIWIIFRETPIRYLLPLDIVAILASTLTAFIWRLGLDGYYDSVNAALMMIIAGLVLKTAAFYFLGLYQRPSSWTTWRLLKNTAAATAISSFIMAVLLIGGDLLGILPVFSRAILLADMLLTFASVIIIRLVVYLLRITRSPTKGIAPLDQLKLHGTDWLKEGTVYYGIVGGALAVYMLWNKIVFGTSSPVSGQIKRWWATYTATIYGGSPRSLLSFLMINPNNDLNAWNPFTTFLQGLSNRFWFINHPVGSITWEQDYLLIVLAAFLIICGILFIQRRRTIRTIALAGIIPLFAGSWIQISSYSITGYASPKEWYWLTECILLVIAAAILLNMVIQFFMKRWMIMRIFTWIVVSAIGIYAGYRFWAINYVLMPHGQTPAATPYLETATYIEGLTKPGDIIGMTGGGNVAYFIHDRTIVNMDGLINSYTYFQDMQNGTASDYLYETGMRYVFANPGLLESYPYRGQYTNRLKVIDNTWGGKYLMELLPKPNN